MVLLRRWYRGWSLAKGQGITKPTAFLPRFFPENPGDSGGAFVAHVLRVNKHATFRTVLQTGLQCVDRTQCPKRVYAAPCPVLLLL